MKKCPFSVTEHWIIVGDIEYSDDCRVCVFPDVPISKEEWDEWDFGDMSLDEWWEVETKDIPKGTLYHHSTHSGEYYKNDEGECDWNPNEGRHSHWETYEM